MFLGPKMSDFNIDDLSMSMNHIALIDKLCSPPTAPTPNHFVNSTGFVEVEVDDAGNTRVVEYGMDNYGRLSIIAYH